MAVIRYSLGQQFIFVQKGKYLELVPKRNIDDIRGSLAHASKKGIRDRGDDHKRGD
jgi:hypothetical protein